MTWFVDETTALCATAADALPAPFDEEARSLGARLAGPLRIAVAGRVKAGKSTLLNALIGQRVAATDAGECTRLVTWYVHGSHYAAHAVLADGSIQPIPFERDESEVRLELGHLAAELVDHLRVEIPAAALATTTFIDTPGLASIDAANSRRTERFLDPVETGTSPVDAVVYLMRHAHQRDVAFLDAFMDRSVAGTSPINAVAVLSRADEIGAGRLDALVSARRIASRYAENADLRSLTSAVVSVAGLLAETAATLREDEVGHLRRLAADPAVPLDDLLVTVDRFLEPSSTALTVELRSDLLDRLGLFGVRYVLTRLREQPDLSTPALAVELTGVSGIDDLRAVLAERFAPRGRVLQAKSVLSGLRSLAMRTGRVSRAHASWLDGEVERIESGSHELGELRLLHLALSGAARLHKDEHDEVRRLVLEQGPARLGTDTDDPEMVRHRAIESIGRWRLRAEDPLVDPPTREAAELVTRSYETIYAGR